MHNHGQVAYDIETDQTKTLFNMCNTRNDNYNYILVVNVYT